MQAFWQKSPLKLMAPDGIAGAGVEFDHQPSFAAAYPESVDQFRTTPHFDVMMSLRLQQGHGLPVIEDQIDALMRGPPSPVP
jgi:hypothetical protein